MFFLNTNFEQEYNLQFLTFDNPANIKHPIEKVCPISTSYINFNSWMDLQATKRIDTSDFIIQEEIKEKKIELFKLFQQEYNMKNDFFESSSFDVIFSSFTYSINQIFAFYPKHITVGISEDECVFIYSEIGNKSVLIDLFFEGNQCEVAVNIKKDKKFVCSFVDDIEKAFVKLDEFIGNKKDSKHGLPF